MSQIVPISLGHITSFHPALGKVVYERKYLVQIDVPSIEWGTKFMSHNIV